MSRRLDIALSAAWTVANMDKTAKMGVQPGENGSSVRFGQFVQGPCLQYGGAITDSEFMDSVTRTSTCGCPWTDVGVARCGNAHRSQGTNILRVRSRRCSVTSADPNDRPLRGAIVRADVEDQAPACSGGAAIAQAPARVGSGCLAVVVLEEAAEP